MPLQLFAEAILRSIDGAHDSRYYNAKTLNDLVKHWHLVLTEIGHPPASESESDVLRTAEQLAGFWQAA
jgi:hypothetical protein